mmetsp:Transcript_33526/g.106645  ORF Transcript_33526/g.106645 Transcript_33526/m.106645 type:complete len:272 (+) Transcript_33526:110-925(+)
MVGPAARKANLSTPCQGGAHAAPLAFPCKALSSRMDHLCGSECSTLGSMVAFSAQARRPRPKARGTPARMCRRACPSSGVSGASATCSEEELVAFSADGHVFEAMQCPHANHLLQKGVQTMKSAEDFQFVADDLRDQSTYTTALRKFGCRVVQRLIDMGREQKQCELVQALLPDVINLALHPCGNYVVQHMSEFLADQELQRVMKAIRTHVSFIAAASYGIVVVCKALSCRLESERAVVFASLHRLLVGDPELLVQLLSACSRNRRPGLGL